ncbi:hypothetical protein [Campylobacter sp. RM16187]|uniref:hypothetical protein n=1 Tax=Campylobacter sp. RM16187 TaxID=1660063 RepID=UPI0021B5B68C|nr:hypothetical protein [Campylobacter sp. RM16187]QKG28699.1 hypothetical protein CDOMF_0413 [Campylobacter sp. RM16187]
MDMINNKINSFKKDYKIQTTTDKNGKVKKKSWQKKMTPFTEILITFGTTRPKNSKEGLNDQEVNLINSLDLRSQAQRFVNAYCLKYGVECISIAEHNDEKVKHYQILFENYDYSRHACIRRSRKEMQQFGSSLQDMAADAFSQIAVRGVKGSKSVHKNLKQMHQAELEFKSEQELHKQISTFINQTISKFITKDKHLFGDEYYELDPSEYSKLIGSLRKQVLQIFQDKIYIVSEIELKEQINELTTQLLKNSEILQENKDLLENSDKLKTTNNQLVQENANLLNQDNLINEQNQKIENLESIIKTNEEEFGSADEIREKFKQIDVLTKENKEIKGETAMARAEAMCFKQESEQKEQEIKNFQEKIKPLEEKAIQADILECELVVYKDRNLELSQQNNKLKDEKESLNKIIVSQSEEISALRHFKTKVINFFSSIIKKIPVIKDFLQNELPEVASEVQTKMTNMKYEMSL